MAFDLDKLRIERVNAEVTYHAAYTFYGLKGVIAERWAHGPIFGAVGEAGTGQLNLTPASGPDVDQRLVGVLGIRASGLLAEGPHWASQAETIAKSWFEDIFTALRPQRTVRYRADVIAIYPIRDPYAPTRRLVDRYYQRDHLEALTQDDRYVAAVEFFAIDEQPKRSVTLGALGPPHKGLYFNFENAERDRAWWLGIRVSLVEEDLEGIAEPATRLHDAIKASYAEISRLARAALPAIVGDQ